MVLRLPLLTAAFSLIILLPHAVLAGKSGCLACHKAHYVQRGGCTGCHGGNDRTDRKRVAHDGLIPSKYSWFTIPNSPHTEQGKRLIDLYACRRCHSAEGRGNRLAMDLDTLKRTRRPEEIAHSIEKPAQCMPDFHLSEGEVADLVNAVLAGGIKGIKRSGEIPIAVHFTEEGKTDDNIFEWKCGGCHRILTEKYGGLGRGNIGPNLSGFLTPFYPKSLRGHERWSAEKLRRWLENPRRVMENAAMPPIPLKSDEFGRIADILNEQP